MTGAVHQRGDGTVATPKLGTVCSPQSSLWFGCQGALGNPLHYDLPLLNGFPSILVPLGMCELWGALHNLWFVVVVALGFWITSICFPEAEGPFVGLFATVCPGALVLAANPHRFNTLLGVVILDPVHWSPISLTHIGEPGLPLLSSFSGWGA